MRSWHTTIANYVLRDSFPTTTFWPRNPRIPPPRLAKILMSLDSIHLSQRESTLARRVGCCIEQRIWVTPRDVEVVLCMDQMQIDVLTLADEISKTCRREPRLLDSACEKLLEKRIRSQGREYRDDATDGVGRHESGDIGKCCSEHHGFEFNLLVADEVLCHCCRNGGSETLTHENNSLRRNFGSFHGPFHYGHAVCDQTVFGGTPCRVSVPTVIYCQDMGVVAGTRTDCTVGICTPALGNGACIAMDCEGWCQQSFSRTNLTTDNLSRAGFQGRWKGAWKPDSIHSSPKDQPPLRSRFSRSWSTAPRAKCAIHREFLHQEYGDWTVWLGSLMYFRIA